MLCAAAAAAAAAVDGCHSSVILTAICGSSSVLLLLQLPLDGHCQQYAYLTANSARLGVVALDLVFGDAGFAGETADTVYFRAALQGST